MVSVSRRFPSSLIRGNIEDSNSNLHLAVNGTGFFALADDTGTVYSRDGAFLLDEEGFLVNSAGLKVQAFPPVATGENTDPKDVLFSNGVLADIQLDRNIGRPSATGQIDLGLNFRSDIPFPQPVDIAASGTAIDPAIQASFDYTNTLTVYDSLRNPMRSLSTPGERRKIPIALVPSLMGIRSTSIP